MPLVLSGYGEFVDDYDAYLPLKLKRADAPRSIGRMSPGNRRMT